MNETMLIFKKKKKKKIMLINGDASLSILVENLVYYDYENKFHK
jgi:hypothetical protein